jgi:hypothetical protein
VSIQRSSLPLGLERFVPLFEQESQLIQSTVILLVIRQSLYIRYRTEKLMKERSYRLMRALELQTRYDERSLMVLVWKRSDQKTNLSYSSLPGQYCLIWLGNCSYAHSTGGPSKAVLSTNRMALTNIYSGLVGASTLCTWLHPTLIYLNSAIPRSAPCRPESTTLTPVIRSATNCPALDPLIPRNRMPVMAHASLLRRKQDSNDA